MDRRSLRALFSYYRVALVARRQGLWNDSYGGLPKELNDTLPWADGIKLPMTSPHLWIRENRGRFLRRDWCEVAFTREGFFCGYWTALVPDSRNGSGRCLLEKNHEIRKFSSPRDAISAVEEYLKGL